MPRRDLLIPRRTLLQAAALATPFISKQADAFVPLGASATPGFSDRAAIILASLGSNTWSNDIVLPGNHTVDVIPAANNSTRRYSGDHFNWGASPNFPGPESAKFAFSSGCYMNGQKKYALPGTGGHTDWSGSEIAWLDFATAKWVLTEQSCLWGTTGIADPSNPTIESDTTYKPYPNPAGRRSHGPLHTYSGCTWCPEISVGFSQGGACWNTGGGTFGAYMWDVNGRWNQSLVYAGTGNGCNGQVPRGIDLETQWISALRKLWSGYSASLTGCASLFDPLTGTTTNTCSLAATNGVSGDNHDACCPGTIIPDPGNPGDTAHVFWANDNDSIFIVPKVGSGAMGQASSRIIPAGWPSGVPAALRFGQGPGGTRHGSGWFDFAGNYKPGSKKILVWDWFGGTGLYLLDYTTWTFTGPLSGSAMPYTPGGTNSTTSAGGKLIFVATDYMSVANYLPIGLIQSGNGQCYFYKIPWAML
jgi:hypothetical protein